MNIQAVINILVSPKSSRSTIIIGDDNIIKVYLHSPPAEGKANAECIKLFSKSLGIPKSAIEIDKGEKGRKKKLIIHGLSPEEVHELLRSTRQS